MTSKKIMYTYAHQEQCSKKKISRKYLKESEWQKKSSILYEIQKCPEVYRGGWIDWSYNFDTVFL